MRRVLLLVGALPIAIFACSSFDAATTPSDDGGAPNEAAVLPDAGVLSDAASSTLSVDLIARWRFDETSGSVANNDVETAPTGAVAGAKWVAGQLGGALEFAPVNQSMVTVSPSPTLDVSTAFTMSVWCNLGASLVDQDQRFVHRDPIDFKLNGRRPQIGTGSNGFAVASYVLPENEWHLITATYDSGKARMFIDGIETTFDENTVEAGVVQAQDGALFIGALGDGTGIANGRLDDVRVWRRALTSVEVRELFKER
jgi:hypothetical protein